MGILSVLIFLPLPILVVMGLLPAVREGLFRWMALGVSVVQMGLAWGWVWANYGVEKAGDFVFVEDLSWLFVRLSSDTAWSIRYVVGIDGASVGMVLLCGLMMPIVVLSAWNIARPKGFFMLLLLLDMGMMGSFCALDLFLFYVFFELILLPMFFHFVEFSIFAFCGK